MVFEEALEQLLVADLGRVVADLHDLGVAGTSTADLLVRGVGREATRVADGGIGDSWRVPEQLLGAPEAAEGKVGHLGTFWHLLDGDSEDVVESGIDQNGRAPAWERLLGLNEGCLRAREQHVIQSAFLRCRLERSRTYATLTHPRHVPAQCVSAGKARRERRISRPEDRRSDERNAVFGLGLVIQSRFVKSDDNVGFQRDARARKERAAYAGLL